MKQQLVGVFKLICFIFLVPFLYSLLKVFYIHVSSIAEPTATCFGLGAIVFIVLYLFVYSFTEVYVFGQTMVTKILFFAKPIAEAATLVFPIYAVILSLAVVILKSMGVLGQYESIGLMAISFFWVMHVVLTAKKINEGDKATLKGGYFFDFALALTVMVVIAVLLLAMLSPDFSLAHFFKQLYNDTLKSYHAIYRFLFISPS